MSARHAPPLFRTVRSSLTHVPWVSGARQLAKFPNASKTTASDIKPASVRPRRAAGGGKDSGRLLIMKPQALAPLD